IMAKLAFATYEVDGRDRAAILNNGAIYDAAALRAAGADLPKGNLSNGGVDTFLATLCESDQDWSAVAAQIASVIVKNGIAALPDETVLRAPYRPHRMFCAASNFVDHADEMGTVLAAKANSKPYMFLKLQNCIIGTGESIVMPQETEQLDWEVELAAVIG